jgi:hypothetical protein
MAKELWRGGKIDWDRLQGLAESFARPVSTLYAQSGQTDPFYVGEARMRDARWFADLYHEHEFSKGVHIRRIHYCLVSQESPVPMPDGADYERKNALSVWAPPRATRAMPGLSRSMISLTGKTLNRCSFWLTHVPRLQ